MNKTVFLDRDGTINIDYGYVHETEKLEFVPGVLEALKEIQDQGFRLIIVTNQSGIGRGYFTKEAYAHFNEAMLERMAESGVVIDRIYTCPHVDADQCNCRKPRLGLFEEAIKEFDVDLTKSFAIGDRLRDLSVCDKYPIKGILYTPDESGLNQDNQKPDLEETDRIIRFDSWKEIAEYICGSKKAAYE